MPWIIVLVTIWPVRLGVILSMCVAGPETLFLTLFDVLTLMMISDFVKAIVSQPLNLFTPINELCNWQMMEYVCTYRKAQWLSMIDRKGRDGMEAPFCTRIGDRRQQVVQAKHGPEILYWFYACLVTRLQLMAVGRPACGHVCFIAPWSLLYTILHSFVVVHNSSSVGPVPSFLGDFVEKHLCSNSL